MDKILINPGPLTSFNSLSYHLGPHLNKIRNQYIHGNSFEIELNLTELNFNDKINVSALAALLSTLKCWQIFKANL